MDRASRELILTIQVPDDDHAQRLSLAVQVSVNEVYTARAREADEEEVSTLSQAAGETWNRFRSYIFKYYPSPGRKRTTHRGHQVGRAIRAGLDAIVSELRMLREETGTTAGTMRDELRGARNETAQLLTRLAGMLEEGKRPRRAR